MNKINLNNNKKLKLKVMYFNARRPASKERLHELELELNKAK